MKKIPLIKPDLPSLESVAGAFREILRTGKITNFGRFVSLFEETAGAYLGGPSATVSSGTLGLVFTLQALGLKPGQKVIVPSFSFMASAQAILYAGGIPVFADIGPDMTLSPSDLERLLSKHKDATFVMPVHMFGHPCQVEKIQEITAGFARGNRREIRVVYDAAHAFGSKKGARRVGTFGDAEVFSLSVTKALVCVEGGLVVSRNAPLIRRVKKMRNYGNGGHYDADGPGLNGKMSEFHAIIGLENLKRLEGSLSMRARKAGYYARRILQKTCFQPIMGSAGIRHTYKDFTVLVPPELKGERDAIVDFLNGRGVETRTYFHPPIHQQRFFRRFADRRLPATEDLSRRVVTLPFFTTISEKTMDQVVRMLQKAQRRVA